MLISEAVACLEAGMFGGAVKRAAPVAAAKKVYRRASIGLDLHKQKAAEAVDAAVMSGDLSVNVFTPASTNRTGRQLSVPVQVLGLLTRTRGGLPDHAIRVSPALLRDNVVTSELFAALSNSAMYLQRRKFDAWYDEQKSRRRWPSQRTSKKPRSGRPLKQTDELFTSIRARVAEGTWSASDGIAKLAKLLISNGAPKRNSLRRAVDQLYEETGDPQYHVVSRHRTKAITRTS
jgi:hypothetical protein